MRVRWLVERLLTLAGTPRKRGIDPPGRLASHDQKPGWYRSTRLPGMTRPHLRHSPHHQGRWGLDAYGST